ncbi:unnamed protein product [Cuscuta epithymum]|uniref:Gag protein n=1 Tax=Cuscuta epithymum TaxID=186058 RepID=A0AAV0FU74_9ASTE|nr:unnamed protein product [Cuscuta epithymum]CAH9139007.1 unnamed protein product [Cuscuta epithymum]
MTSSSVSTAAAISAPSTAASTTLASDVLVSSEAPPAGSLTTSLPPEVLHPTFPSGGLVSGSSVDNQWVPPIFTWTPTPPTIRPSPVFHLEAQAESSTTAAARERFGGATLSGTPSLLMPHAINPIGRGQQNNSIPVSFSALAQGMTLGSAINQIVTTKLLKVEDYLPWRTQFESFLVANGVLGILDGSLPAPPLNTYDLYQAPIMNPEYYHWLKLDQTIRAWLFATLSREVLMEVHTLKNSTSIWQKLESRFMAASLARSMELKHQLSHTKKKASQSMEEYVRGIQTIADNLASINSPVSDSDLLHYTLYGLGPGYESLVGPLTLFPEGLTFDKLCTKLVHQEARLQYQQSLDLSIGAPAFSAQSSSEGAPAVAHAAGHQQQNRGGRGGRRGRGRGRGRGRYHQQPSIFGQPPPGYGQQPPAPGQHSQQFGQRPPFQQQHSSGRGQQYNNLMGQPGFPSFENNFGSVPPPVVCQICHSPGHSAVSCSSRFLQSNTPALAVPTGESTPAVWYPDSGASAHMTANEGQNFGEGASSSFQ